MNRRALLTATGVATAAVTGCTGILNNDISGDDDLDGTDQRPDNEWHYEDPARNLTAFHGKIIGTEVQHSYNNVDTKGGIVGLDAETGNQQWRYGSSSEYSGFPELAVNDAVYATKGVVQSGTEAADSETSYHTTAIECDGTVRWSDINGKLERIDDSAAYVTSNARVSDAVDTFRAIDTTDGHERWSNEYDGISSVAFDALADTPQTAYIAGEEVVAVAADDGSQQWRYEHGDAHSTVQVVADDVAYVTDSHKSITAVSGGEALWSVDSVSLPRPRILTATSNYLFAEDRNGLYVFDTTAGGQQWVQNKVLTRHQGASRGTEQFHRFPWTLCIQDDIVYVGGDWLYAVELDDGTQVWSRDFGEDEPVQSLEISAVEPTGTEYSIFIQTGETNLHKVAPNGDVQWTWTDDGKIYDFTVDELVVVSTENGTVALKH